MKEAKEMIVGTCSKVIEHYAQQNQVQKDNINIRIDLENIKAKPVFGIFNRSTLIQRQSLSEIVKATGGASLSMILNTYVKKVIRDIFTQSLKQLEITDSKRMFVLLYQQQDQGVHLPFIALYKDNEYTMKMKIEDIVDTQSSS